MVSAPNSYPLCFLSYHTFPCVCAHTFLPTQLRLKPAQLLFSRWVIYNCVPLWAAWKGVLLPSGLDTGCVCRRNAGSGTAAGGWRYEQFTPGAPFRERSAVLLELSSHDAGVFSPGHDVCCLLMGKSSSTYGSYPILLKCWLCSKLCQKRFVFFYVCQNGNWLFLCPPVKHVSFREYLLLGFFSQEHLITEISQLLIFLLALL